MSPLIIAELGSNPAPVWDLLMWCAAAKLAGADAVKVQIWHSSHFPPAEQNVKRKIEFPRRRWLDFVKVAHSMGLFAGASVFDDEAIGIVAREGDFIKLAAREQGNIDLILGVLNHGGTDIKVYRSISEPKYINYDRHTTHLATISQYPTSLVRALLSLPRWARFFNSQKLKWGWSSHTRSIWDAVFATRLGASVIEKHFALSSDDIEAGHSLLPCRFERMVKLCK